jgi:hypothetical protein
MVTDSAGRERRTRWISIAGVHVDTKALVLITPGSS